MPETHNVEVCVGSDKAKPSVRGKRKVAGLLKKMAELPKDETSLISAFLLNIAEAN